jgi:hypothetical protein
MDNNRDIRSDFKLYRECFLVGVYISDMGHHWGKWFHII